MKLQRPSRASSKSRDSTAFVGSAWIARGVLVLVFILCALAQYRFNADFIQSGSLYNLTEVALFDLPTLASSDMAVSSSSPCCEMAKEQSLGFFTDIPDIHWKQMQKIHARVFPNYKTNMLQYSNRPDDRGNIDRLRKSNWWNGENYQVEFHCPMAQRVPPTNEADGPKWVCDPHRLAHKKDCLIYSFGSNGKAEFEHGIIEAIASDEESAYQCEMHTFDMVTQNRRNGDFAEALKGASTFHPWGLGTPEQAAGTPSKFKTLEQTMEALGHTGRTIDIFKIDCEWCEWFTYDQFLKQDIRQILVETHNAPMPQAKGFFQELHDAGYVIFSKEANYQNAAGGVEFAFLKVSQDFFVNQTRYDLTGEPEQSLIIRKRNELPERQS